VSGPSQIEQVVQYGVPVVVGMGALVLFSMMMPSGEVTQLSINRPDELKDALFGGEPWLVSCYADGDLVASEFKRASTRLKEHGIATGVVDCSSVLPSNKTIYKRLGLKAKEEDLLAGKRTFFVGNGRKAVEYDTSQANTENNFVNFARRYAELWLHQPRTAMEMERVCYKKKSCAVVLTNGKPGQNDLKAIKAVSKMNRLLPVVLIDIAKANFTGYTGPTPRSGETPKLSMFLKPESGSGVGFKPYKKSMGNVDKMAAFVKTMTESKFADAGLTEMENAPVLIPKELPRKKKSKRSKEEIKALKEKTKADRRAAEKAKRAKMDEEMGDLIGEAEDTEDSGDGLDEMEMEEFDADELEETDEEEAEEADEAEEVDEE